MKIRYSLILILVGMMLSLSIPSLFADVSGSFISNADLSYSGPGTFDLNFRFFYYSPDAHVEYIDWISLTFPTGVTVNSATDIQDSEWNGETGDGVTTTWGYNYNVNAGIDEIFTVNVTVEEGFTGHMNVDWWIQGQGDIWGWNQTLPPHEVWGSLEILLYSEGAPEFANTPSPSLNDSVLKDVDISWINGEGTESIKVYLDVENPPTNLIYSGAPIEHLSNSDLGIELLPETRYFWQVECSNESYSSLSPTWSFTIGVTAGEYFVGTSEDADFSELNQMIDILSNFGMTGPIVIKLEPGKHIGPFVISTIRGASEENKLTITSTDATDQAVLTRTDGSYSDRSVLRLEGANNVRIESLTFDLRVMTAPWGIHILKKSKGIEIIGNSFVGENFDVSITASNSYVSSGDSGNNVEDLLVQGNLMNKGSSGVTIAGPSTGGYSTGVRVLGNKFQDQTWDAIRVRGLEAFECSGNVIDMSEEASRDARGMFIDNTYGGFQIVGNRITNAKMYGLYFGSHKTDGTKGIVANNMIGGGFETNSNWTSAIHIHGTLYNVGFYFNSLLVNLDHRTTASAVYMLGADSMDLDFVNNSFTMLGNGTGYAFLGWPQSINRMDYNCFYSSGQNFVYYGNLVTTLEELQEVDGKNLNSRIGDPDYLNEFDLHTNSVLLYMAGTPIEGIDYDIDGDDRDPVHPCIGADEYVPILNHDVGAINLTAPEEMEVGGTYEFEVTIVNYGVMYEPSYYVGLVTTDGEELASLSVYEPIWPGEELVHTLEWTPTRADIYELQGQTSIYLDMNPYNDKTPPVEVYVAQSTSADTPELTYSNKLGSNFPNPFNPETTINFSLKNDVDLLELSIYNVRGQLIRTLIPSTPWSKGTHRVIWDGMTDSDDSAPSGIYFYQMSTPTYRETRKMMLLK